MTTRDPLRVLHADDPPVQPDPAFTAALRTRLESALSLPAGSEEIVMSGTADVLAELDQPQPTQEQPLGGEYDRGVVRRCSDLHAPCNQ